MPFPIIIDITAEVLGDDNKLLVTKRVHNKLLRETRKRALLDHWKNRLPSHFLRSAFTKYPEYERRSVRYQRAKAKRFGTTAPNVKTGRTRREILQGIPRITSTARRSTMTLRASFKGGGRGKSFAKLNETIKIRDRIEEIEAINTSEQKEFAKFQITEYLRLVNRRGGKLRRLRKR